MRRIIEKSIDNVVFGNLLMVLVIVAGIISAFTMVREVIPRISLDIISVSVPYPGADPEEVEEGICIKLEEALDGIEGIKRITTTASTGAGTAFVECEEDADVRDVKDEVTNKVDSITTFPKDAEKPIVTEIKAHNDVLSLAVWGDLPEEQLKEVAREIEEDVLRIKGISQVSISGARNYEISIEVSEKRLRAYGLRFGQIRDAVAENSLNLPCGIIRTSNEEMQLRVMGRKYNARDYEDIPVLAKPDGTTVTLGQVAVIKDSFDQDVQTRAFFNGKPSVSVDVFKTESEDAIRISKATDRYLERKIPRLPPSVHITKWKDSSSFVRSRINLLVVNGFQSLALVFLALWLFLDIRLSLWVAAAIPISLAGSLAILGFTGETLNMISLFGLIMVVGLIVDDAIVVGDSIYRIRKAGMGSRDSAVEGTSQVALPVISSVLTTVIAFLPLFFVEGIMGKFICHIPLPVIAALSVSLFECLIVFPIHMRKLPMPAENVAPDNIVHKVGHAIRMHTAGAMESFVDRKYGPFISKALEWRYFCLSAFIGLLIVTLGLIGGGIVKLVLFPESDNDFVIANIELLPGATAGQTELVAEKVFQAWKRVEARTKVPPGKQLTKAFYTIFGGSIMGPEAGYRGNNNVEVVIELLPTEERNIYYRDLLSEWEKETGAIPDAVSTDFSSLQGGPGGNPLEIRIYGKDREVLLAASDDIRRKLDGLKGVYGIKSDYRPGLREFRITLKPEAYQAGYSISDVAGYVNAAFYGSEALRIQRGRDDVKVKVRFPELEGRNSMENFEKMWVRTAAGKVVPVSSLVDVRLCEGESSIKRENRRRLVTLSADVNRRIANAEEISRMFDKEVFPALRAKYPGVEFSTEGQAQEWRDSLAGLKIGFALAALANYVIIATQFRSYMQPIIILVTIPFGFIGAVLAHLLFGLPLTMMSMFGLVALSGIVVNDAIVLIDCVNKMMAQGMTVKTALAEAGKRRFRAVFLTTLTTFCGLMPIVLERSMQALFLIPMAVTIAFGVAFATLLTLILVPCLFMAMNDIRRLFHRHPGGAWPSPEDVEPAAGKLLP